MCVGRHDSRSSKHAGGDGIARERLKSHGPDELRRTLRHHDKDGVAAFAQLAGEIRGLVGRNRAAHPRMIVFMGDESADGSSIAPRA